jgi:electron transfer flavoprotein alpha subunit
MSGAELWVWLPRDRAGRIAPAAAELLYEGAALARRLGAALVAASDRVPAGEEPAWLGRWGVARVRALGVTLPPHPSCPGGASPLRPLLESARAEGVSVRAVLLPGTTLGRVVAPLLAVELDAACVTGASSVTSAGRHFVTARPTLGEQYEALATLPLERPLVATLRPGAVGDVEAPAVGDVEAPAVGDVETPAVGDVETPAVGDVEPPSVAAGTVPALVEPPRGLHADVLPPLLPPDPDTLDIADAERIVAFGRGAFSREAVALVERLARALGATVAGTRPAADEGWLPFARQVGLTGAIVQPRLYVAVGISGAPYHMVGIREPETLIAINSDPDAPIFGHAHLGLVGDLHAVLPALLARLERGEGLPGAQGARGTRSDPLRGNA